VKKILFISHEASRTGAPLALLGFIKYLCKLEKYELNILFLKGGDLISEFDNYGNIEIVNFKLTIYERIINRIFRIKINKTLKLINKNNYDLIYINSLASIPFIKKCNELKCENIILHIHERIIDYNSENIKLLKEFSFKVSKVICVSKLVVNDFAKIIDINNLTLKVIYPITNSHTFKKNETPFDLFKNLPSNSFIVGGSGNYYFKKGIDLFIDTASLILNFEKKNKPIYFIWAGGFGNVTREKEIINKIKQLKLENNVLLLPLINNPIEVYRMFDVFYNVSKEESFGLAAFENGLLGNPIICFENTCGIEELISKNNGKIIKDREAFIAAKEIIKFYTDPNKLLQFSEQIKDDFGKIASSSYNEQIEKFILN